MQQLAVISHEQLFEMLDQNLLMLTTDQILNNRLMMDDCQIKMHSLTSNLQAVAEISCNLTQLLEQLFHLNLQPKVGLSVIQQYPV